MDERELYLLQEGTGDYGVYTPLSLHPTLEKAQATGDARAGFALKWEKGDNDTWWHAERDSSAYCDDFEITLIPYQP